MGKLQEIWKPSVCKVGNPVSLGLKNQRLGNPMPVGLANQCQCICQLNTSRLGNTIPVDLAPVSVSEYGKVHLLYCESIVIVLSLQMPVFHRLMGQYDGHD